MKKYFLILLFLSVHHCLFAQMTLPELFKKVDPAVVVINTQEAVKIDGQMVGYEGSLGTGVLISEDGEILTAAHVVQNAEYISVEFVNGETIPAEIIRNVKIADVALIKLRWMPKEYTIAKIGDSNKVEMGESVFIIGSPFGLSHSLSKGVISSKRAQQNQTSGFVYTEFFQTDAAINQGNSGGPMCNMKGEVIGIVSYILSKTGGFDGIGFAATSNLAKRLLIDKNTPWTGIDGMFLNEKMAAALNVAQGGGLLVQRVTSLSPADLAGIKGGTVDVILEDKEVILGGDIILEVSGVKMVSTQNMSELFKVFQEHKQLKTLVPLKFLRDGEIHETKIDLNKK